MNHEYIWWKHGAFYQIYPRSFADSNADGIGDLEGVIGKLDYLADLGVDAIWISPIFPSPMADFGYDVSDYTDIHPMFGDLQVFDRLLDEAHQREMRIVLDYVPNHSSDEHAWFIESRSSRENPKRDWYIWRDAKPNGSPPNNWESHFGGSAWEWDEATGQYYLHLFLNKQPDLNWTNPDLVKAMHNVLRFWLDKGVDGFRMDVVTFLMKHPELLDNPMHPNTSGENHFGDQAISEEVQEHKYDINQPEIHDRLREFRQIFDEYSGDRVTIGETWFFDPVELATYYGKDMDELHVPFNFMTLETPWNAQAFKKGIEAYYAALPEGATPNFVLGNHDKHRLASRYGVENLRSAGMLLLTLWGIPTMYYGDEIGMVDGVIPEDRIQDPVAIQNPGTDRGRDPERTPMQWTAGSNAGFSSEGVEPWLPVSDNYPTINVEIQDKDPHSTLNFYRKLLKLRRENPALHMGQIEFVSDIPEDVLGYQRWDDRITYLVLINFSSAQQVVNLREGRRIKTCLLSTHFNTQCFAAGHLVSLAPHEAVLLEMGS